MFANKMLFYDEYDELMNFLFYNSELLPRDSHGKIKDYPIGKFEFTCLLNNNLKQYAAILSTYNVAGRANACYEKIYLDSKMCFDQCNDVLEKDSPSNKKIGDNDQELE